MTTRGKETKIAEVRGPINGLIVETMRRHSIANVRDFADHAGISRATVYDLVRGRSTIGGAWMKPSLETLVKLAVAVERPTHELLYLLEPEAPGANLPPSSEVVRVPVMLAGYAGAGAEQMVPHYWDQTTYVEADFAHNRDLLAFRIAGDSMDGGRNPIHDDDLVIVDRRLGGEVNSPVVARLNNDGYVCKRLRPRNFLDSTNPDFLDPDLAVIEPERIAEVVGKVVRIIHTFADAPPQPLTRNLQQATG
jgi:repressor LexA